MQSKNTSGRIRNALLLGSSAIAASMAFAGVSYAQDSGSGAAVSEVVVTGSRIARRDLTSNSPIVTVSSAQFENTSNVAIEATLNKLPQFVPDQNMTGVANSGDVQPTATHTVGISTASLRGLGPNRNLVLVDGRRMQPINGELIVDLNTIPSAMVDRVEVITGGASAVYGADAVGGVVNFILKKNFQGIDVDTQYGTTQHGDGTEFKISALIGGNFADDRGNATFGVEHYTRAPSWQRNRSFYTKGFGDPTTGTNEFFDTGAYFDPTFGAPSQAAVNALFSGASGFVSNTSSFYFNNDGTVWTGTAGFFGANGAAGVYRYKGPINGTSVAYQNAIDPYNGGAVSQVIKTNQTNYYVTAPVNRWSMYGSAHYDFSDDLSLFINGSMATTHTHTILFPTPFITGWGVVIPRAGHATPAELTTLLDSRAAPGAPFQISLIPDPNGWLPPRSEDVDNDVWQITAGLDGKLPVKDWTWEAYGSHGQSTSYDLGLGYVSLQRYQEVLQSANYGANTTFTGNQELPNFGFGVASAHCTSGFYDTIFMGGTPSQDCIDAITAKLQSRTLLQQNIAEFDAQGGLFDLPAGEVRGSVGASYREDALSYNPDVLQSTSSFQDQVAGVYPTAYMDASTSAKDLYGELLVPLLKDLPFVQHLGLELGARYSTYAGRNNLTGQHVSPDGGWTYKILGDWAITDWARLRGGYNLAVRAPNVGELFLGKQEVYAAGAATSYGDPCSTASSAPFGAGGAVNPVTLSQNDPVTGLPHTTLANGQTQAGANSAANICAALMGAGANLYYTNQQAPGAPSPFGFVYQAGQPNLQSEKAKTWTGGIVLRSPWQSPLLSRTSLSVDWYRLSITGAIEFQSVDNIKAACLSQSAPDAATAAAVAASPECQLLTRNTGTGAEAPTTITYDNLATIKTSGVDVQFNWMADFSDLGLDSVPGALSLSVAANWLDYFNTVSAPGQPEQHWAGTLGPSLTGTNAGAFKYKTTTTLTYLMGPGTLSLNWRHLPKIHSATFYQAGNTTLDTQSHDEFGLYGTWNVSQNYFLRAGVDNLLNKAPPITGASTGIPGFSLPSTGQGGTNEGLYDALGRRFYVGLKAKF